MTKYLSLTEAANELGITVEKIRRWGKKGLIKPKPNGANRLFSIEWLKRIRDKYAGEYEGTSLEYLKTNNPTNFRCIEIFSGAGGLALGLENAGFKTELLVEIDEDSAKTLEANRPNWNIINKDIKDVDLSHYKGKVDLIAGGFPCQAFSYAGHGKGFEDTRGTLFFEFAKGVKEIRPKIALAENVRGLINHDEGRTLNTMLDVFQDLGYRVSYKLLKAQFLDVPQKRERIFIIGVRGDLDLPFIYPKEKNYTISLRNALDDCPLSEGKTYNKRKKEIMEHVPEGGYWKDLPEDLQKEYMKKSYYLGGGKTGMARRLSWNEPSLTLTTSPAQKQTERCHPSETRPLTVREYARIQTFPDDWEFAGSMTSKYKQIGNAVPVNLGYYIGRCLIAMLEGTFDEESLARRNKDDCE